MAQTPLTRADIEKLLSDPSGTQRAETARTIATMFDHGALGERERKIAEDIFRIMVRDAEVRVRMALAVNLKASPLLPHDIAVELARDVNDVALPVLECSAVLTDDDLLEIVSLNDPDKQSAIAGRPEVSEVVSDAIVDTGDERVVTRLVANPGARISDGSFDKVVETLGDRESVQEAMVSRPKLPVTVAERLVTLVSEHLRNRIASRTDLSANLATELVLQIRERAILSLSADSGSGDLARLVDQLKRSNRLTPSIILRALCMGDLAFFETAMAANAGISVLNARELIHDRGNLGLRAVCEKAGFPATFLPAARAAVSVTAEMAYDGGDHDRERYSRRMIERILTQYGDLGVDFEADDLEYLLSKMTTLPIDTPAS